MIGRVTFLGQNRIRQRAPNFTIPAHHARIGIGYTLAYLAHNGRRDMPQAGNVEGRSSAINALLTGHICSGYGPLTAGDRP